MRRTLLTAAALVLAANAAALATTLGSHAEAKGVTVPPACLHLKLSTNGGPVPVGYCPPGA